MAAEERTIIPNLVHSAPVFDKHCAVMPHGERKGAGGTPLEDEHERSLRGRECILMVDDEKSLRDVAEYALSKLGYRVISAPDGEGALQLFKERRDEISLIVLDLIMPGMGGRRCLEKLLQTDPGARVIVVSGYTDEEPPGGFLGIGAKEFVTKPYDMKNLTRVIRTVLDS